jgi:predicted ATPase/class 3 adenylate cyclase
MRLNRGDAAFERQFPGAAGRTGSLSSGGAIVTFVPPQPTGTVTLLFTDIEGSTRLWELHPEVMAMALQRHDTLLRSAIESAGGYVFKTVGDAFCSTFTSAEDALQAAGAAQRALHSEPWPPEAVLRVRMALHTGECEERDGDYFGPAVNRTARLEATAHGGQVVVSGTTAALVQDHLPPGVCLVDLGSHYLKDLGRPEDVFQLTVDGLQTDFPPLRSQPTRVPTNLTEPVSSFVGRDAEVTEVTKLLGKSRLVTLTGSGGVGKTRLATEVGRAVLNDTADGVWLVELATVSDPELVASEVLRDLDIHEQSGKESLDTLVEVLATQNRVIILDNCEQVVDGCAVLADAVMRHCPGITLLSTSRELLRIDGEVIYRVPSLSLPPDHVDERSDLVGSGAVALFIERASTQVPAFELTDGDAALVASICRRLDGMPLALELATARLRSMSLAQLHDRLERRFDLLTGGSRVALPRQQTLRALVDWSYDLLSEPERVLLRRASVFVDSFDLEGAEGVCGLGNIPQCDIADLLASLVEKSLVVAEPHSDITLIRYRLLETLRQYAAERLAESGVVTGGVSETEQLADAHADYYLSFTEQAAPHLNGRSVRAWFKRLDAEELNLRAAFEHLVTTPAGADRILHQFWLLLRYWPDAPQPAQKLDLLERALDRVGPGITPSRQAEAYYCKASLLGYVDLRRELETALATLDLARAAGDPALVASALSRYSRCLADNGREQEALDAGARATALARTIGDPVLLGTVLVRYATALDEADDSKAEIAFLEALGVVEQSGDELTAFMLHNNYATLLLRQDRILDARRQLEMALILTGTDPAPRRDAQLYLNLGWVLLQEGDTQRAASYFADVLQTHRLNGTIWHIPYTVLGLACCATCRGESELAAMLHGGADAWLMASSDQWESLERIMNAQDIDVLRERLGANFESHYAAGFAMPLDEMVKVALSPP